MSEVASICRRARAAARRMGPSDRPTKDALLKAIASALRARAGDLLTANARDLDEARARGTSAAMLDRLALDARRVEAMAAAVEEVAVSRRPGRARPLRVAAAERGPRAPGQRADRRRRDDLRGAPQRDRRRERSVPEGGERGRSARRLRGRALERGDRTPPSARPSSEPASRGTPCRCFPRAIATPFASSSSRSETVDLVIPRGGEALIRFVTRARAGSRHRPRQGRMPHLRRRRGGRRTWPRVSRSTASSSGRRCATRSSASSSTRPMRARLLPPIARALLDGGCELRGCERTRSLVPEARAATDDDWGREYLDRILAVRVVDGLDGALDHVARYGSGHTEAICTRDAAHAERWRREVDAACVVVNASTRLHDGGELGLGAEIGTPRASCTGEARWASRGSRRSSGCSTATGRSGSRPGMHAVWGRSSGASDRLEEPKRGRV